MQACNQDVLFTVCHSLFNNWVSCAGNCFLISFLREQKPFRVQQATKSLHGRGEPASQYEALRDFALLMGIFASISFLYQYTFTRTQDIWLIFKLCVLALYLKCFYSTVGGKEIQKQEKEQDKIRQKRRSLLEQNEE